jgi:hypothetical protein
MIKNVLKICGFWVFFAMVSSSVFAVSVEVTLFKKEFSVNDQFEVFFKVDAQGKDINAMQGKVDFSSNVFSVVEIKDGNSIVGKWVEKPVVSGGAGGFLGGINFSYIIPNGYKGVLSPYYGGYKPGKMFSIIFSAKKAGTGYIKISDGKAYLNDGDATKMNVSSNVLSLNISAVGVSSGGTMVKKSSPNSMDVLAPDKFALVLSKDENISEGKWFLAFDAKDNDSGVDHYEVYESLLEGYSDGAWSEAESPYVLKDQNLSSYVYVKAVDGNGNGKVETFEPSNIRPWYSYFSFWIAVVFGGLVVFFAIKKVRI